jgi:hypothetical protein
MAGFLTDYTNNKVLDSIFGNVPCEWPSYLYFGLSSTTANKLGCINEPPAGHGYERVQVANNLFNFTKASYGTKGNLNVINFDEPTADWGQIRSVFIADTEGNVIAMADLTFVKTYNKGSLAPRLDVGALFLSHS